MLHIERLREHLLSGLVENNSQPISGLSRGISTVVVNVYVHMGFLLPQWKHRNLIRGENADYMPETWSTFDACPVNPSTSMETVMLSDDRLEAVRKKVLR